MNAKRKRYQTQWAAQFFAAAELTRRGYLTPFTLGNAPVVDLLVVSPNDCHFRVDVKGLSSKNYWLVQERESQTDLYYILVYLSPIPNPPNYYILRSDELMKTIGDAKSATIAAGKKWVDWGSGISWGAALQYHDRWDLLPS